MKKRILMIVFILTSFICLMFGIVGCETENANKQSALCRYNVYVDIRNTDPNYSGLEVWYLCADVTNISNHKIKARLRCDYAAEPIYSNFVELEPNTPIVSTVSIKIPSGWATNGGLFNKTTVEAAIIDNNNQNMSGDNTGNNGENSGGDNTGNNGENSGENKPTYETNNLIYDFGYENAPSSTQTVKKGETVNLIIPERAGYEFSGWYYNYSKIESGVWQYDNDITLTARWNAINYSITYNTDGGIVPDYYLESFTVYNLPYTLPIPTKQGSNFAGWYENADFSGEPITEIPKNSLKNYVLYAKYSNEQLLEFELSFDETYYSVIGYKGNPQYITVPETIDGLPIKEIAANALNGCTTLKNITLSENINKIGSSAFAGCDNLISITIPDGVTSIGSYAFSWCSNLTSITIPDGVTIIGSSAFSSCSNLTSITIPDGVTSIGSYAFSWCSRLTSISIPDSVTTIGSSAFNECSSLTSIIIPDSVISIGSGAFSNNLCKRYSGCYYLPTKNSEYGFLYKVNSTDITNVKIHTDCKTINSYAFYDCSNLTSIIIPDSVMSIGNYAFGNCSIVFYKGTADDWSKIKGSGGISKTILYYYSATEPTDDGNYWNYDTDGITPVIWEKEN